MTDQEALEGADAEELWLDTALPSETQDGSERGLTIQIERDFADDAIEPLSESSGGLPETQCFSIALREAFGCGQIRWQKPVFDEIVQSSFQQIFASMEPPPQYELLADAALAFCRLDMVANASSVLVAESGQALAAYTESLLASEFNSLTDSIARQLTSETTSVLTEMSRSLGNQVLASLPKVNNFDLSALLPDLNLSEFRASVDAAPHFAETFRALRESPAMDFTLSADFAETWQHVIGTDAFSSIVDRNVYIDQLAAREHFRTEWLEQHTANRSRASVEMRSEVRTESQLVAGQREILARLERLERKSQQSGPMSLPTDPPVPGLEGNTWDDVFDWFYKVPREWCVGGLQELADRIGMAYGTVKNKHSLYLSDKRSSLQ